MKKMTRITFFIFISTSNSIFSQDQAWVTNLKLFGTCYSKTSPELRGTILPNTLGHQKPIAAPAGNKDEKVYIYCEGKEIGYIPAGDTDARIICDWASTDKRCKKKKVWGKDVLTWGE